MDSPSNSSHFKPGQSGNPAGRPQGSRNKKTLAAYNDFFEIFIDNLPKLKTELEKLSGKDYVSEINKMSDFVFPRMNRIQSINVNIDETERVKEVFVLGDRSFEL